MRPTHLLLILLVLMAGCAQQPAHKPVQEKVGATPALTPQQRLELQARQQWKQGNLTGLTLTLEQLAPLLPREDRPALSVALHEAWRRANGAQIEAAWQSDTPAMRAWALYGERIQAGDPAPILSTLQLFSDQEAPLLALLARQKGQTSAHTTLAVFLPLTGPYAQVGLSVRNGMVRVALAPDSPEITLRFYDTHGADINTLYQEARDAGADVIIGPLLPANIAALSKISALPTLLLNRPANGFGHAFSFQTLSEAAQLNARLRQSGIQRLGILFEDHGRALTLQNAFSSMWLGGAGQRAETAPLPHTNRTLRTTLDQLLHVDRSKARRWALQRQLGHRLTFTPRARRDLQALLLLTDAQRAAVLNPLMSFYDIDIPRYGSSLMMPERFDDRPQPDLAGVRFPAFPALVSPGPLTSPLEAWGWDALQVAFNLSRRQGCYNGRTGRIELADRQHDRWLEWLQYTPRGQLTKEAP